MKTPLRIRSCLALFALGLLCFSASAQDPKAAIQKALEAHFALTQPTADNTEIVTGGAVLVLQKNSIMMIAASSPTNPYSNIYKDGKISQGGAAKAKKIWDHIPGATAAGAPTRTFVRGESMWVTNISVKPDGVYFDLFTDVVGDSRYKGTLRFAVPTDSTMTPQQIDAVVSQVFTVRGQEETTSNPAPALGTQARATPQEMPQQDQAKAAAVSAPPPVVPPPAVVPPPPPPDQPAPEPPTITMKQTREQVESSFGKPTKVVDLGKKQIYFYKDMKVTFTDGKVSNIE